MCLHVSPIAQPEGPCEKGVCFFLVCFIAVLLAQCMYGPWHVTGAPIC